MKYNKLVRDKIPEIIRKNGETPIIRTVDDDEYWDFLNRKLVEEVNEFLDDKSLEEFADVLEVLHNIAEFKDFSHEKINNIRKDKNEKKGSFKNRIVLEEVK